MDLGPVAILRGSHRYGVLPLAGHMGPGRRQAKVPRKMLEELRWVTTDFSAGDVLVFTSMTVHAALHNITETDLRLSVDFRYQLEGEALTDVCLEPHFQRVTWEEIYAGWARITISTTGKISATRWSRSRPTRSIAAAAKVRTSSVSPRTSGWRS